MLDNIVRVALQGGNNFSLKSFALTYVGKVCHTEYDVLTRPHIPEVKFGINRIGGKSAELILCREHILYRPDKHRVELLVLGCSVGEACAAHHLAPILTAPSAVFSVLAPSELIDQKRPGIRVKKLIIQCEIYHLTAVAAKTYLAGRGKFEFGVYHKNLFSLF